MNSPYRIRNSLIGAALLIGGSAMLAWLEPEYISKETSLRLLGVMLGMMVVVYANGIPKLLVERARRTCSAAAGQAARRFAGWSMVLGGIGYILAFLFAPIKSAPLIACAVLLAAMLAGVVRCLRVGGRPRSES